MDEAKQSKVAKRVSHAVTAILIFVVALCLYVVIQVLNNGYAVIGGFTMFRVVTGSMEPTISVGSLLVCRQAEVSEVACNDIICFRSEDSRIYGSVVTHRVVQICVNENGEALLQTKGDANPVADGYLVTQDNFIGKVVWHTGGKGVLAQGISFLTDKVGFLGCIVFPCLILAIFVLRSSIANIQEELRRAKEELEPPAAINADNLLSSMTRQEYEDMVSAIREELMQELSKHEQPQEGECHAEILKEQDLQSNTTE